MNKINFASDNYAGIHPDILKAITETNKGHHPAYGDDLYTAQAKACFHEQFGLGCEVFFVLNGTAANVTSLSAMMHSFEAVICSAKAHIQVDECGAPEKLIGSKLLLVPTRDGKISPEQIKPHLERVGDQHHVQPRVISISQSTEYGTVYTLAEIEALARFAHDHKLYLHIDGARISNAAASLGVTLKQLTRDVGADALSFGGTKNGLMIGEAVVFFNSKLSKNFQYIRKQSMQLTSKMRFISAQFSAFLANQLWLQNARHANQMAQLLASELVHLPSIRITQSVEANAIFAIFPPALTQALQQSFHFYVWDAATHEVRLMTSFDTQETDVLHFIAKIKELVALTP